MQIFLPHALELTGRRRFDSRLTNLYQPQCVCVCVSSTGVDNNPTLAGHSAFPVALCCACSELKGINIHVCFLSLVTVAVIYFDLKMFLPCLATFPPILKTGKTRLSSKVMMGSSSAFVAVGLWRPAKVPAGHWESSRWR